MCVCGGGGGGWGGNADTLTARVAALVFSRWNERGTDAELHFTFLRAWQAVFYSVHLLGAPERGNNSSPMHSSTQVQQASSVRS